MTNNSAPYIAALDVGGRRIGVALAHRQIALASPHTTLLNDEQLWLNLQKLIADEQVGILVLGLPRGLDGQETDQTRSVQAFAEQLKQHANLPIYWQDEAGTSVQAEAELKARGKGYNKEMIDAYAATIILEDFLQNHKELAL